VHLSLEPPSGAAMDEDDRKATKVRTPSRKQHATARRGEALLRRERVSAQRYLDLAGVMFVALDTAGIVTLANKRACDILGYPEAEIVGSDWFDRFLPDENRAVVRDVFRHLVAGDVEPAEHYENPVVTRGGEERVIAWQNSVIRDRDGTILGTLSSGSDITELRRTERERGQIAAEVAVRERADVWLRVQRVSAATIRITAEHDVDRVLQEIVDSAREAVGCRYAALGVLNESGDGLAQFTVSGISAEDHAKIGALPGGRGVLGLLIRDRRSLRLRDLTAHPEAYGFPDNHPPMKSFLGTPIVGRTGPIGNLYLTEKLGADEFTDDDEVVATMLAAHAAVAVENARYIDEREMLLSKVQRMRVSRDRFFAMINHELRNALTAVHGWAELWVRKAGADAPKASLEVLDSAKRAITLLEDVLDLSRLDAAKLEPKIRDVNLWDVVRESTNSVEPLAEERGVRIETAGPEGAVKCKTDPQRVRQILINLLTNAVRHGPSNDVVTLEIEADATSLHVHVVDRGDGISADEQAMIFGAFERAGADAIRGTGLGLTLSRKLARLLAGDLRVENGHDAGARFTLDLPREAQPT
jgi:PAS domain S-box-containing protein